MIAAPTAAIAGAAQVVQRPLDIDPADARGPIELMVDACRAAAADAGSPHLLRRVGWIGVVGGWWRYTNPGQIIAEHVGSSGAGTALSMRSGSSPQELLGIACDRIARGQLDVALVVGGEARWSARRLKREGLQPRWTVQPGDGTPERLSPLPDELVEEATLLGGAAPTYALFQDSLRVASGRTVDEERDVIAQLWSRLSDVAASNPWAWDTNRHSAAEIRDASPSNRMIAFPYTKAMVAKNTVDMASALLICSRRAATDSGVAADRLVFPHVVTTAHDTWRVVERRTLHRSPALDSAGRTALDRAGVASDEIDHVDLYSCFPVMVQMSSAQLGLSLDRPPTVTGGLCFAGAPVANAAGQAIAGMVPLVRAGGIGLVHANGGMATKHAIGVYSARPPERFALHDCQDDVDHDAREPLEPGWSGRVLVEAGTVLYDRTGPTHALVSVLDEGGRRRFAKTADDATIGAALAGGVAGRGGELTPDGSLRL